MNDSYRQFIEDIHSFLEEEMPDHSCSKEIDAFLEDIRDNKQRIAVLGEFKRGKSTLVNALLRQQLMPVDILPVTAVLHKIKSGDSHEAVIHKTEGDNAERIPTNAKTLFHYTYDSDYKDVTSIELAQPLQHLGTNVELIDTPGIGDLNEHRFEVTYEHIPRADLIIFVFDMTTPIRKTELTYLKDTVLPLTVGDIIFAANFSDRVEEEEQEEILEYMEKKLKNITGKEQTIYPVSSVQGFENPEEEEWSVFEQSVKERMASGSTALLKEQVMKRRFHYIFSKIDNDMEEISAYQQTEARELEDLLAGVQNLQDQKEIHLQQLHDYMDSRKQDIYKMVEPSVRSFYEQLYEQTMTEIDGFDGEKTKEFFESSLPKHIDRGVRTWIHTYTPQIDKLLAKVQAEVSTGMAAMFNRQLDDAGMHSINEMLPSNSNYTNITFNTAQKKVGGHLEAGSVGGGAAAVVTLFGGGVVLLPLLLAGMPFLKDFFKEKNLNKFKAQAKENADEELQKLYLEVNSVMKTYIDNQIDNVTHQAISSYEELLLEKEMMLKNEISYKENASASGTGAIDVEKWNQIKTSIGEHMDESFSAAR